MNRREWLFVGILWLGLIVATSLPFFVGQLAAGPRRYYVGRVPITAADTTAYFSLIEQARQGRLLFANQFTAEAQRPTLFHPLWLAVGWIGAIATMPTPWVYHVARWIAIGAFLIALTKLLAARVTDRRSRWLIMLVVATSSGLGWAFPGDPRLGASYANKPPDVWVAESNTFLSFSHSALFVLSQLLLLAIVWMFWRWSEQPSTRQAWKIGGLVAVLTLIHPYDLVTVGAVIGVWSLILLIRRRADADVIRAVMRFGLIAALLVAPILVYYFRIVIPEPAMAGWLKQNIDISGPFHLLLAGYGLLWPLAAFGVWRHRRSRWTWLLVCWVVVVIVLMYAPGLSFQRRLSNGLHLPIAWLAGLGLVDLGRRFGRWRMFGWVVVVIILLLTNVRLIAYDTTRVLKSQAAVYPPYISRDEATAMFWLRSHSTRRDVVLSEVWVGNAIPGLTGRTVALGHGHQTIDLQLRLRDWLAFRRPTLTAEERSALLHRLRITWLFWRTEDGLSGGYQPAADGRWREEYRNQSVRLYRLR